MIERFIEKFNSWDIQSNLHNSSTFRKVSDFHYEEKKKLSSDTKSLNLERKKYTIFDGLSLYFFNNEHSIVVSN